jgi:hypothetical protein
MNTNLGKHGKEHDKLEHWLGKHNRKFELLRTLTSGLSAVTSIIVLLKLFNFI